MDTRSTISIELATTDDVPAILSLANWAAAETTANFASEPEALRDWIDAWHATATNYPWFVARSEGDVVGFAKASPHRARGAYRWTAEVTVYVHPSRHGAGIGAQLYRHLIPTLRAQGYVTLLAGITHPNVPSERLHAAVGFVRCGSYHRAGWKFEQWHDVGYWELHLVPAHRAPTPIRPVSAVWPIVRDLVRTSQSLTIRRSHVASVESQSLIGALDAELSAEYPEPGATHFRLDPSEVSEGMGGFFVIDVAGEAIGCGAIRLLDPRTAELKRMFVAAEWRGLGIAKHLLAALEDEASRIGATHVRLETGARQRAAVALYERSGYERIAAYGEYVDSPLSVCMEKRVTSDGQHDHRASSAER